MKKQWLITGVLVMSMLAFAACGKKQESAAGEGDQTGAVQETEAEATEEVKEEVEDAAQAGTDLLAEAENAGDAASDAIAPMTRAAPNDLRAKSSCRFLRV